MKPYVEPSLTTRTSEVGVKLMETSDKVEGWIPGVSLGSSFAQDPAVLDLFRVATKYLYYTDFGKNLLKTWRDEFSESKTTDENYTVDNFTAKLGHLQDFTGRNLGQLLKHYLSPDAIESGAWTHEQAWTSQDGIYVAHRFESFRPQDSFLWIQEVATGRGALHLAS